jgi:hypothetical protein
VGLHDADPRPRLRYLLVALLFVAVIVLLVAGATALHALAFT